jgi:hypothetical protein
VVFGPKRGVRGWAKKTEPIWGVGLSGKSFILLDRTGLTVPFVAALRSALQQGETPLESSIGALLVDCQELNAFGLGGEGAAAKAA